MGVDEELAGHSDQDDLRIIPGLDPGTAGKLLGGLPAAVMRPTKAASAVLVRLALSAHM